MKTIFCVVAVSMLCVAIPAYAANGTLDGGTGLVAMRTADTLQRGQAVVSVFAWGQAVWDGTGRSWDVLAMPGIDYGIFNNLEIGVGAPYRYSVDSDAGGLRALRTQLKFRFFNLPKQGISAAVTAYGGFMPSGRRDITSGDNNYGAEVEISMPRLLKPLGIFHASLGFEKSDTKQAAATITYRRQIKKRLNMGVEVPFGKERRWNGSLEILYTRARNVNDALLFVSGLRYAATDRLTLLAAGSWGTPRDLAQPEWRVLGGISCLLGSAPGTTQPPAGP